jgi:hypothetical protein
MITRVLSNTVLCGVVLCMALLTACCGGLDSVEAELGEEFSLAIGRTASIRGDDLEITFLEVIEDSRCPREVTCVWEGRVSCSVELTSGDSPQGAAPYRMVLIQPGLSDEPVIERYEQFQISYRVDPYPRADEQIPDDEYRLILTITD